VFFFVAANRAFRDQYGSVAAPVIDVISARNKTARAISSGSTIRRSGSVSVTAWTASVAASNPRRILHRDVAKYRFAPHSAWCRR
jgi:hypothetical protein